MNIRAQLSACLAALLLLVGAVSALAAPPSGDLSQLPAPDDCIGANACGTPAGGGLHGASAAVVAPDGKNVYVTAAGNGGALTTFSRGAGGKLTLLGCIKSPSSTEACASNLPGAGTLSGANDLVVSPPIGGERYVYVAAANNILVFHREQDGSLTELSGPDGCISQGGANGCVSGNGLTGVSSLAVSPDGTSLYATSQNGSTLAVLSINQAAPDRGALAQAGCFRGSSATDTACGSGPMAGLNGAAALVVSPNVSGNQFVYVVSNTSDALVTFARNTTTGALSAVGCLRGNRSAEALTCSSGPVDGLDGADGIAISPGAGGANLYVTAGAGPTGDSGNTLTGLARDPSNGNVTVAQCFRAPTSTGESTCTDAKGLTGAANLALTGFGTEVYVVSPAAVNTAIARFDRAASGALTQPASPDDCYATGTSDNGCGTGGLAGIHGAVSLAIAPDVNMYVPGPTDNSIAELAIEQVPTCADAGTAAAPLKVAHDTPLSVPLKCSDLNGDTLTRTIVGAPRHGQVINIDDSKQTASYVPTPGSSGADSFTFRATDTRSGQSALATVFLVTDAGPSSGRQTSDEWLPSNKKGTWTWSWYDSAFATTPTKERYTVTKRTASTFTIGWTTDGLKNPDNAVASTGTIDFARGTGGVQVTSWSASPPPSQFPILCATASNCPNSLSSSLFILIWGSRSPLLAEPLLKGENWSSLGGGSNDVQAQNRYIGRKRVVVPAFPHGVNASVVRSEVSQAGALGDPYGSGERTVWWVRGVGPVKIEFRHSGGQFQRAQLQSTNLVPRPAPSDANLFPLVQGRKLLYRWRNSKHMRKWATQRFTIAQVLNNSARVDVASVRGPIRVAGSYTYSLRLDGLRNIDAATKAVSLAKFPPLGPRGAPAGRRRHFFTAFDLMDYGFNPVLTAYPAAGQTWRSTRPSRDFSVFGVNGRARILGYQTVRTPAGKFRALAVRTTMTQPGFRFGSGTRTSWFAPNRGLVKLVFRHGDRSVSTVELTKH